MSFFENSISCYFHDFFFSCWNKLFFITSVVIIEVIVVIIITILLFIIDHLNNHNNNYFIIVIIIIIIIIIIFSEPDMYSGDYNNINCVPSTKEVYTIFETLGELGCYFR